MNDERYTCSVKKIEEMWEECKEWKQPDMLRQILTSAHWLGDGTMNAEIEYSDVIRESRDLFLKLACCFAPSLEDVKEWIAILEKDEELSDGAQLCWRGPRGDISVETVWVEGAGDTRILFPLDSGKSIRMVLRGLATGIRDVESEKIGRSDRK